MAIQADTHLIAHGFHHQIIPAPRFQLHWKGRLPAHEQLGYLGLFGWVFFHGIDVIAHVAFFFVDQGHAVQPDLSPANVAVMAAREFPIIKLDINHRRPLKLNAALDDAVLRWDFQAMDCCVRLDDRLAVLRWAVHDARLRALERTRFKNKGIDDSVPGLGRWSRLKVVREQQFLFHRDRLRRNLGQFSGWAEASKSEERQKRA